MFQKVSHAEYGDIDVPGIPFRFSESEGSLRMPAPGLGEHSRLVLEKWLGYPSGDVDALFEKKVVL
jgi:crotonobetainyl-CoA:carnitine CoA-transferase CaiB-like acyl-CoA transferase